MKSARVFVLSVLCLLTVGAAAGTAAAETGHPRARTTMSSAAWDNGDSGWGRLP
ncbi:hypothetical protein ABZ916_43280 [Streptomyces sp. NPDC046853]|uniref:hypothetical protein n=1 Tax=Streptomyces sp. NPDC046853 TaxID=3154920 RepID=UPI0033EFCA24